MISSQNERIDNIMMPVTNTIVLLVCSNEITKCGMEFNLTFCPVLKSELQEKLDFMFEVYSRIPELTVTEEECDAVMDCGDFLEWCWDTAEEYDGDLLTHMKLTLEAMIGDFEDEENLED